MNRLSRVMIAGLIAGAAATGAFAAGLPRPPSFAMRGVCHKTEKAAPSGIGPNLFGIGGRQSASAPGYQYSPAMKATNISWTRDKLITFIVDPRKTIVGTKMAFAGIKNPQQAAAIADYLLSLK